jgi:hypothetical protein
MKATIFNLTALALIITTSFIGGRFTKISNNVSLAGETVITAPVIENPVSNTLVKAIKIGDEILPVVDLPTLEIEAEYNRNNMVKAIMVDGEIMPFVQLPELTIEG